MNNEINWDRIEYDLGHQDHDMRRSRPYSGQPHTDIGERGKTKVEGVTFRDLRDCYLRDYCLSLGAESKANEVLYNEAMKGEHARISEHGVFGLDGEPDLMAVFQNFSCEVEKLMGIYPNVPKLEAKDK